MSKISSVQRVIEILKDLDNGKILCMSHLAYKYDINTRSIRRDFALIRDIFGDILISPKKGCYQTLSKTLLNNTLNSTELYMLKNILKLSEKSQLSITKGIDESVKKAIIKEERNSPYIFKNKPYEEIYAHKSKFKFLENAIRLKKEIKFKYTNLDKVVNFTLKPYRIIFLNENFYLGSEFKHNKTTLSRIAMMSDLSYSGNTFEHNIDIMDYFYFMQSPWAIYQDNFRQNLIEVIVQIPKEQAKYFKLKKFLPSQKILSEDKNGNLTISYTVLSQNEVTSLIKQWIPYIKVIKPESLVNMFKDIAKRYTKEQEEGSH
jgi:predicted DNA-binding transcriptional regulator YafY